MSVFSKVYEDKMQQIRDNEEFKNIETMHFLETVFASTVIGTFSYKGDLPEFIKQIPDYIEETIYYSGVLAYFMDGDKPYITIATPCGRLLENGLYSQYQLIFRNGRMLIKNIEDIELLFDNYRAIPPVVMSNEILEKCYTALRAVEMALKRASTPDIYVGADEAKISAITDEIKKCYDNLTPYAIIQSDWIGNELQKLSMYNDEENKISELWETFVKFKNLHNTVYGINNVEISKTERLTKRESESNSESIRYTLLSDRYQHRVDWCNRIKSHFGKTIICEINRNADTVVELSADNEEKKELYEMQVAPYAQQIENQEMEGKEDDKTEETENNE